LARGTVIFVSDDVAICVLSPDTFIYGKKVG